MDDQFCSEMFQSHGRQEHRQPGSDCSRTGHRTAGKNSAKQNMKHANSTINSEIYGVKTYSSTENNNKKLIWYQTSDCEILYTE